MPLEPEPSCAVIVAMPLPATVGAPEITPDGEIVTPAGRPVAENVSVCPELSFARTVSEIAESSGQLWEAGGVTVITGCGLTVIVSDSDVRVGPDFLRAVVQPFSEAKVGGVTCLYRGLTDGGFAADLEALGNSADFAPGVLVARLFGGLDFMLGAVMATTKKHLAEIGGFESLADYFCDDYELGNRIAARGYRVELSRFPVDIVYPRETIADAFRHQLRWNLSIRYSRPWGHLGLIFSNALPWAALVGALVTWRVAAVYLAIALFFRIMVAISVGLRGMRDRLVRRDLWMLPVRDAFAFVVWLASFFPQRIHWRDRQFRVRDKRLIPVARRELR